MSVDRRELRVEGGSRRADGSQLVLRPRTFSSPLSTLNSQPSRGLTLIELLVVIIILTTLVSAAIPILAPSNDDRRLREASRGANSFISAAQMRAIQTQRPFGVAIKRLAQDTNTSTVQNESHDDNAVSVEMFYVEQPAPYRGFDRTSSARVARHTTRNGLVLIEFVVRGTTGVDALPLGWDADLFPVGVIRPGDVVEIDGTRYELLPIAMPGSPTTVTSRVEMSGGFYKQRNGNPVVQIEARPLNDTGQVINVEYDDAGGRLRDLANEAKQPVAGNRPLWTHPAPYKILRQPMPTPDEPFQFPEGTAIDLRASGLSIEFKNNTASGFFFNQDTIVTDRIDNGDPVIIMFTPEGSVERLRLNTQNVALGTPTVAAAAELYDERPTSNIYLLIGRRENAPPPPLASDPTLDASRMNGKTEEELQELKETVNWLRGESRWIVIGSQSGRVATVENAFVEPRQLANDFGSAPADVRRARQINAAREFAREMSQMGGR